MPPSIFDKTEALKLYHQHKTDTEIAKAVGSYTVTIRSWRNREGLTNISPSARPRKKAVRNKEVEGVSYPGEGGGVDYRSALNPEQANAMNKFLRAVLWAGAKAREAGIKPDVGLFIKIWRGNTITSETKKKQAREYQRRYEKRKKESE